MVRSTLLTIGSPGQIITPPRVRLMEAGLVGKPAVVAPPAEWPDLPDVPMVRFVDFYRTGDSPAMTMDRLTADGTSYGKPVLLPDGFDGEWVDYKYPNKTAIYYPKQAGFVAEGGPGSARITIKANSSTLTMLDTDETSPTYNQIIPTPYLNGMRLGDGRNFRLINYGFIFESREQPETWHPQSKKWHPADNCGIFLSQGRNAYTRECIFRGFQSDHNYPPGEMFTINDYRGIGNKYYGCEVDGRHPDTKIKQGGSPFGYNASQNGEVWDCYFHDSWVSGYTASFAGSSTDINSATNGMRTVRTRIHRNSNNANPDGSSVSPGGRFTAINNENVIGVVSHEYCDFLFNQPTRYWDQSHTSLTNKLQDNPTITFIEPTWEPLHSDWNGCFVVKCPSMYDGVPNKQTTAPRVVKNGVELIPFRPGNNGQKPKSPVTVDPKKYYIIFS